MIRLTVSSDFSFFWQQRSSRWTLRETPSGQNSIPLHRTPFSIGRASDCQLVLPNSAELAKSTSRWHCHIVERDEELAVVDGSLSEIPGLGRKKPSITGTYHNGSKIQVPKTLREGDSLKIGPWAFTIKDTPTHPVEIDSVLERAVLQQTQGLTTLPLESKTRDVFSGLHHLFGELNQVRGPEEALTVILSFAMANIKAIGVAAVLLEEQNEAPEPKIAWHRDTGRIFDLKFSSALIKKLSPDQPFFFESCIAQRSKSQINQEISSALLVPLRGVQKRRGILYFDNCGQKRTFTEDDLHIATALAAMVSIQLSLERQEFLAQIERSMRRYFGPDVVQIIVEQARAGKSVGLDTRELNATVLFVDMAGFCEFSRIHSPREVVELLNPYFQLASECIQRHEGHVDKFIGDAVMGVFGASPTDGIGGYGENHAVQSVRAAQELIRGWHGGFYSPWGKKIPLRAGISSGKVIVGNLGFRGRMEYSVLGEVVNLASRLEKLAHPNGIVLSDSTHSLTEKVFRCEDFEPVDIRGFGMVNIWHIPDVLL